MRYAAALVALTAILLCALLTWAILEYEPAATPQAPSVAPSAKETVAVATTVQIGEEHSFVGTDASERNGASSRSNWRALAICAWLIGVAIMLLRAVCTAAGGARLRRQCRPLEDERILALVEQLRQSIGIARRVRVAVSQHISVPGVVGCIWPTLLLPVSMVSGIATDDLRAILAHELAHVKRYDYLVNFCQMLIEAIFFFNPAVWWISKQVRFEREACCDKAGIAATGQRIRYAEALAEWAQRLKNANVAAPAIGFGKPDDSGGMLERVRRIVIAGHRPRLTVSWYIAAITLIISLGILVGLWRGTTMTVALAGKLLTPQQRIDTIRKIEKSHPTFEKREYTREDEILISGSVKTIDGKPLGRRTSVRISSKRPNHGSTKCIDVSRGANAPFTRDGSLCVRVTYGNIRLHVYAKGYAPAFAGPLTAEPGGEIKDLNFILDKGFEGKVRVVNQDDEPVIGAKLVGDYLFSPGNSYDDINLTADENGLAVVEHAVERPARFTVTADGYEVEKFEDIRLSSERPAVLELRRAKKTTGTIFSKETGQPVPDAVIKLLIVDRRSGSHSFGPGHGRILATADDQGRFALTTLRSDSRYLLTVKAAGLGHKILYNVIAGQENMKVYLPSELRIKGRITGPLEKLRERNGKYVIGYSFGVSSDQHSHWSSGHKAEVEVRDGEGHFEIAATVGNRMRIGTGSYRMVLNIERERTGQVIIDLADPVTEAGQDYKSREVVLRFDYPEGAPAPEGELLFRYIDPEFAINTYKNQEVTIRNGQGRLKIPTPGKVAYDNTGMAGYWFDEKSEIKVPYAEEPFEITIPAVPAGSIYGEVFEHDGSKAGNVLVGIVVVEKSPLMGDSPFLNVRGKNSASDGELDTRYVISPLPLGGKYVVIAHKGDLYTVSDQIELDETQPIRQLDITLAKGRTFEVRIVDENGKPQPSVPVEFNYSTPWSHGYSRRASYTNVEGRLAIGRVNPNAPGVYRVVVKDVPGYRPVKMKVENFDRTLEVKLERGHVVTGTVVDDQTGWPIPRAEVYALPTDYRVPEPTTYLNADNVTDEQGRFRFSTMARREYQLNVRSAQVAKLSHAIVTGGDQKEITLRVKLSEWSKLKPRKPSAENE